MFVNKASTLYSNPMLIIDGRKTREELLPGLIEKIKKLPKAPTLAIIQVGNRPDSTSFIKAKKAFAKKIGVYEKHIQLPETISQKELLKTIAACNNDDEITGIIVQLPLPEGLDRDLAIDAILPRKDADGLTPTNTKSGAVIPATARGIRELLNHYKIGLARKKVTVIGRSMLVGKPIAAMCEREGAIVTVCHRQTLDLAKETKAADIIICAVGKQGLITAKHVKAGQVVIDVGINRNEEERLVGDVDFEAVKDIVSAISPVPGGVGPMTVLGLFENLVDLCHN